MPNMSVETKRALLQASIKELYPGEKYAWVEDMTDNKAYFNYDGQTYQVPYSVGAEDDVRLGTPVEVVKRTTYGVKKISKGRRIG